jgi:hypothetical protein
MAGPDCVLVTRSARGYRGIPWDEAAVLQKYLFVENGEEDRLYRTCARIAEALGENQLALAQIYRWFRQSYPAL